MFFDLLHNYLDKNFHVYFDNFYTSYKLVNDLKNKSTFSCGTIRVDRGLFLIELKKSKLEKNKSKFLNTRNIVAVQWKDKHDVYTVSAIHGSEIELVERQNNDLVEKPRIICQYNNYMNGLDKCDQYLNYYSMGRKSIKWWKIVFFRLIELCVVNAIIIYFHKNADIALKRQAHKYFREALARELVQELLDAKENPHNENADVSAQCQSKELVRLRGKHFPVSQYPKRGRCVRCGYEKNKSKKYKDKKTSNFCEKCLKFICRECFQIYHTQSNI